jgi:hypothetical protein
MLTIVLAIMPKAAWAQTPAQMEYERQQREYRQQMERQQQERQRLQQLMNENARRQQEESSRFNSPVGQNPSFNDPGGTPPLRGQTSGPVAAQSDAVEQARKNWQQLPPLPAERNPLLGKWIRPASSRTNSGDPLAQLGAMMNGGLCEVLFGGAGVFEFKPDRLVGSDAQTTETELDRVEYRGDAKHVVVILQATLKLIEFDFEGPDRINWTGQNCVLVRPSPTATASDTAAPQRLANAAPTQDSVSPASPGGVLALSVSALSPADKVAGRKIWILKADPQFALIKSGLTPTPNGTVLQNWIRACQQKQQQACAAGIQALQPYSVGIATLDASGQARTPRLPAGRYWVLSDAKVDNKHVMWRQPVDLKGAEASLKLDQSNVMAVD